MFSKSAIEELLFDIFIFILYLTLLLIVKICLTATAETRFCFRSACPFFLFNKKAKKRESFKFVVYS